MTMALLFIALIYSINHFCHYFPSLSPLPSFLFQFVISLCIDNYQYLDMKLTGKNEPRHYYRSTSAKAKSERSQLHGSFTKSNHAPMAPNIEPNKLSLEQQKHFLFGMSNQEMGRFKRNSAKNTNKSIEELFEENLHLKKQNHRLGQEVMQLRGKFQAKSKNDSQRGKELDLEFQKQLYWGGSKTHLISGIKRQYLKVLKKSQQQEKELNRLKTALMETKYPECQVHAQVLENQNKKLVERLKRITEASRTTGNKQVSQAIIADLEDKTQKLEKYLQSSRDAEQIIRQQSIIKEKKILFLQKLLIEKDNGQYHGLRKIKKLEKLIQELKATQSELNSQIKIRQNQIYQQKKQMLKQKQIEIQCARDESKKELQQLRNKMELLIQDKRQLENNMAKLKMSSSLLHSGNSVMKMGKSHGPSHYNSPRKQSFSSPSVQVNAIKLHQVPDDTFNGYESEVESNPSNGQKKPRVMQTADKRHSVDSKKMRKVHFTQVTQIAQFIKFKLIAANITLEEMKNFFNRELLGKTASEIEWEDEHITMHETKKILTTVPFCLQEESAHLLARYLVEDCNEEFVYCDEKNQNKRDIVKSIMKSLIGFYQLPDQICLQEVAEFKAKYLGNFLSALKTYYPNGRIGKRKFMEILLSMGTDLKEMSQELVVARIVDKSSNLAELQYNALQNI